MIESAVLSTVIITVVPGGIAATILVLLILDDPFRGSR